MVEYVDKSIGWADELLGIREGLPVGHEGSTMG